MADIINPLTLRDGLVGSVTEDKETKLLLQKEKQREYRRLYYLNNKERLREWGKNYYQKNRERARAQRRQYYLEHQDDAKERAKRWGSDNPEKRRQICQDYVTKNPERVTRTKRTYVLKHPGKVKTSKEKYRNTPEGRWATLQHSAQSRGRVVEITFEDYMSLWNQLCFYCGQQRPTHGIDRIDNQIGYVLSNIVPCCAKCNRMKHTLHAVEFISLCKRVADYAHDLLRVERL